MKIRTLGGITAASLALVPGACGGGEETTTTVAVTTTPQVTTTSAEATTTHREATTKPEAPNESRDQAPSPDDSQGDAPAAPAPSDDGGGGAGGPPQLNLSNATRQLGAAQPCGGYVLAGPLTQCEFARNVARDYRENGGAARFTSFNPATGEAGEVSCKPGHPTVCIAGENATVFILSG